MLIRGAKLSLAKTVAFEEIRTHTLIWTHLDQPRKYEALVLRKSSVYWHLRLLYCAHECTYVHSHSRIGSIWRIRKRLTGDYRFQIDSKVFVATTKATHGKNTRCVHSLGSPFVPSSSLSSSLRPLRYSASFILQLVARFYTNARKLPPTETAIGIH